MEEQIIRKVYDKGIWYFAIIDGKAYYFKTSDGLDNPLINVYHLMIAGQGPVEFIFGTEESLALNIAHCSILGPIKRELVTLLEAKLTEAFEGPKEKISVANEQHLKAIDEAKKSGKLFIVN